MTTYSDEDWDKLLAYMEGGKSLLQACREDGMPSRPMVYHKRRNDPDFRKRYDEARACGIHTLVDQCLDICDEDADDAVKVQNKRLRIDTRVRLAGKWMASVYGEKTALIGGSDEDAPIRTEKQVKMEDLTDEQRRALAGIKLPSD